MILMNEEGIKTRKTGPGLMAKAEAILSEEKIENIEQTKPEILENTDLNIDSQVADTDRNFPSEKGHHHNKHGVKKPRRNHHRSHGHEKGRLFNRLLSKIIIVLILLCSLIFGGLFYLQFFSKNTTAPEVKSMVIQDQLQYCQEFVSIKYKYSDILAVKKSAKIGPAKSYGIIKYSAIIRVGIADMSMCDYEVSEDGKSVKVILPDVEVLGNDIINQEVFDEQHSMFVPITLEEVFGEIEKSREDALDEILQDGIITEAKEHARRIVRQMLMAAGYEEVVVM